MPVPTNSHACKTCMIPTRAIFMRVPYIFQSYQCVSQDYVVTQFYKSNATSALVAGTYTHTYVRVCMYWLLKHL